MARLVEATLAFLQANLFHSWGLAIIVFSVVLKIVLFPIGILTVRLQRGVSRVQAILVPQLAEIKANYDGEDAHNRIMSAHKVLGVSPFYSLKPLLGVFIQVPVWIAVFNALGEMPQLAGQSFLWIDDLAYPDSFGFIALSLPLFGSKLSVLPVCMVVVMVCSTALFRNRHLATAEVNAQKRNLYLMAAAFFILFYPFPAVMVMYWTLANMLQTVQQQIVKI